MIPNRFDHQEQSYQKGLNMPVIFDTSDPGTGKTRVQLDLYQHHRHQGGKNALIMAPKSLLYPAWVDDAKKFTPNLNLSVATAPHRDRGFNTPADMYVTNSDAATWLANKPASFFEQFDTLIMDEITYFKNPFSKRSQAMAEIVKYFSRRAGLTGTPAPNHITDIWHQVFLLDDGERLGAGFFPFRNATCSPVALNIPSQPHAKKWIPNEGVELAIGGLIADINIRHRFEDCISIPPTQTTHLQYDMSPKAYKEYKAMERTAILQLKEGFVMGVNKAALMGKLFQICSGSVYTQTGEIGTLDSERADMIVDLCKGRKHTMVFYQWEHQRDYLIKRFKKAGLSTCVFAGSAKKRGEIARRFQNGLYRVFLAHPQSSGYGLTLTRANSWIWGSLTWNLEHFLQGNRRVARAGQDKKTERVIITANNTVEEKVYQRLMDKNATQNSILSILEELE